MRYGWSMATFLAFHGAPAQKHSTFDCSGGQNIDVPEMNVSCAKSNGDCCAVGNAIVPDSCDCNITSSSDRRFFFGEGCIAMCLGIGSDVKIR